MNNWLDLAQDWDIWNSLCECGIEPPGPIGPGRS